MRRNPRRAEVDPQSPRGWATSDRNGHIGNLHNMKWQHEWRGSAVVNTRVLVHEDELDIPQRQLGTLVIPADPPPLFNARPENYSIDEEPVSTRYTIGPDGRASLIRIIINNEPYYSNRIVSGPGGVTHSGVNSSSGGTVTGPAFAGAVWDSSTQHNATLSNGNLTASNAATVTNDQGARVATSSGKTSGKYYFELTQTSLSSGFNYNGGPAVGRTTATYLNLVGDGGVTTGGTNGVIVFVNGLIYASGVNTGVFLQSIAQAGDVIAVAVDLDHYQIWFKVVAGPDFSGGAGWNSSVVGADPATNVGGVTIPSGTIVPFICFGNDNSIGAESVTANFGGSAFSGTVPAGFTLGWSV